MTRAQQKEEEMRKNNPILAAQLAKKREEDRKAKEEYEKVHNHYFTQKAVLNYTDLVDYQDFVNPIFRIELVVNPET